MKKITKIGIADDHLMFAEGISNMINHKPDLSITFITSSIDELYILLKTAPIDILILDINIPPYNGIELINKIKTEYSSLKIMILTMYQPMDIGLNLKDFNGDAYVLKISGKQILEDAFQHLQKNIFYLDPNIIIKTVQQDALGSSLKLTKREIEIVALIAKGKTTKEIASELFLSELTIKTHRKNISEKLDSKGLADMVSKTNQLLK